MYGPGIIIRRNTIITDRVAIENKTFQHASLISAA